MPRGRVTSQIQERQPQVSRPFSNQRGKVRDSAVLESLFCGFFGVQWGLGGTTELGQQLCGSREATSVISTSASLEVLSSDSCAMLFQLFSCSMLFQLFCQLFPAAVGVNPNHLFFELLSFPVPVYALAFMWP